MSIGDHGQGVNWLTAYAIGVAWTIDSDVQATAEIRKAAGEHADLLAAAAGRVAMLPALDAEVARRAASLLHQAAESPSLVPA